MKKQFALLVLFIASLNSPEAHAENEKCSEVLVESDQNSCCWVPSERVREATKLLRAATMIQEVLLDQKKTQLEEKDGEKKGSYSLLEDLEERQLTTELKRSHQVLVSYYEQLFQNTLSKISFLTVVKDLATFEKDGSLYGVCQNFWNYFLKSPTSSLLPSLYFLSDRGLRDRSAYEEFEVVWRSQKASRDQENAELAKARAERIRTIPLAVEGDL
jgi:hypothetical protein